MIGQLQVLASCPLGSELSATTDRKLGLLQRLSDVAVKRKSPVRV
jgi:hypothetical protein